MDSLYENVALLRMINPCPGIFSTGEQARKPAIASLCRSTQLQFKHEKEIVQYLAFLSAYSNDPINAIALCIETTESPKQLTIRWAANSGKHEEYVVFLRHVTELLEREANGGMIQQLLETKQSR